MKSINFVILGDFQIASELGKKGTTTDLSIFDIKLEDVIYTWTVPITTTISNFQFLDNIHQAKQEMITLAPKSLQGPCIISIDHAFNVKGIGTVILGVIRQGTVRTYDQLNILPSGDSILVKSIQMHDDPVNESKSPARVGLAIKGVAADEI